MPSFYVRGNKTLLVLTVKFIPMFWSAFPCFTVWNNNFAHLTIIKFNNKYRVCYDRIFYILKNMLCLIACDYLRFNIVSLNSKVKENSFFPLCVSLPYIDYQYPIKRSCNENNHLYLLSKKAKCANIHTIFLASDLLTKSINA